MSKLLMFKVTIIALFISLIIEVATGMAMLMDNLISKAGLFNMMFNVHKYNGIIFTILVAAHLYQNRGWIKANIFKAKGT